MKKQPIEVYGFGRRLPTRNDRYVRAVTCAAVIVLAVLLVYTPW